MIFKIFLKKQNVVNIYIIYHISISIYFEIKKNLSVVRKPPDNLTGNLNPFRRDFSASKRCNFTEVLATQPVKVWIFRKLLLVKSETSWVILSLRIVLHSG